MDRASLQDLHDIVEIRDAIATSLGGALRELEGSKSASLEKCSDESVTVVTFPSSQSYVMQYRDGQGLSRVAIVRSVVPMGEGVFRMHTTRGEFSVCRDDIQEWAPVLHRLAEPLPDGWWTH